MDINEFAKKKVKLGTEFLSQVFLSLNLCSRPLINQTMNSVGSNSLKVLNTKGRHPSGCKDLEIMKLEFVARTQSLLKSKINNNKHRFEIIPFRLQEMLVET